MCLDHQRNTCAKLNSCRKQEVTAEFNKANRKKLVSSIVDTFDYGFRRYDAYQMYCSGGSKEENDASHA